MNNNFNNMGVTNVTPNQYNSIQTLNNQQSNENFNSNNTLNSSTKKKNKNGMIIAMIIIAIIGGFFFTFFRGNKAGNFDINYSTSFFIENEENKYALFNADGKKITDFIFTSNSDFSNGFALVKKDDAYGIINSNGKMTVDFGKYPYITDEAGLFKVHDDDYHYYLINGSGKVLYDMEYMDLKSYMGIDAYSILEDEKNNLYRVLNYEGKTMVSFSKNDSINDYPSTNEEEGYVSVFYNNRNHILNIYSGDEVFSFDSDMHYCVNTVKDNGNTIILNSCVEWYKDQEKTYYKIYKNGKMIDLSSKCDNVYYYEDILLCNKDYKKYLVDSNFNVGIDTYNTAYFDNSTYAKNKEGSYNGVDFYNNNAVIKNVECRSLRETGYMYNGLYVLGTYYSKSCGTESGSYEYYNSNGVKAFDTIFSHASDFDKNGLAIVSDDGEKSYYLIDTEGKRVTDNFSFIYYNNDGYYTVKKDGLNGFISSDGSLVVDCLYSWYSTEKINNKIYAVVKKDDADYYVYNISDKKMILNTNLFPTLNSNYIVAALDGISQYYTYDGKMFYEKK